MLFFTLQGTQFDMDALTSLLLELKRRGLGADNMLGLLHVVIGRTIARTSDGAAVSRGMSWRDLAVLLKKIRWDPETVRSIGLDPDALPPRDRQKYWYAAISKAAVDSPDARAAADAFSAALRTLGYEAKPHAAKAEPSASSP